MLPLHVVHRSEQDLQVVPSQKGESSLGSMGLSTGELYENVKCKNVFAKNKSFSPFTLVMQTFSTTKYVKKL